MPRVKSTPVAGQQGYPGPGFLSDFYIGDLNPNGANIIIENGEANLKVDVYDDSNTIDKDFKNDGDNIFALSVDDSSIGFEREIYAFDEEKDGEQIASGGSGSVRGKHEIGLNQSSSIQTAYVLIYDDDMPSRRSEGDDWANNYDFTFDNKNDTILAKAGDDTINTGEGNDIVFGQDGNDNIQGGEGEDYLNGGNGKDTLDGGNGKDTLNGGKGEDILSGGYGNDIYIVDNVNDVIIETPGTGIETVESSVDWDLKDGSGLDHLYLKGNAIKGIGNNLNNEIYGNDLDNYLDGGNGTDTLDGGKGKDTLSGGYGNDIYLVDDVYDVIIETPGTGIETVKSSVDWDLKDGSGLDHLYLIGYGATQGIGNNLNNEIYGNYRDNILEGKDANDTLIGGNGDDTLTGGNDADTFVFESLKEIYGSSGSYHEGIDTITDFKWSEGDKIQISKVGFGASDTNQFIYDSSTGALSFDASASDSIAAIQFATLSPGINFVASRDINLV
ncbi:hypothetical protein NIES267_10860 [Calothrix parasitica NIES-267]|uniref:Hemolysin-type calcium-binding region n=1 Tax=Calothrix parasitica NIES-267 TaxID=1973488 RepID=A0A1Z4LKA2_9CYAN|nr:hypothetical protein NIES267_10860 [Calothrix parasitica NIES-267]